VLNTTPRREVLDRCAICSRREWREKGFGLQSVNNRRGHVLALLCESCYAALGRAGEADPALMNRAEDDSMLCKRCFSGSRPEQGRC
jgi:primosomal protein N'